MPFILLHDYLNSELTVHVRTREENGDKYSTAYCRLSGEFPIRFPGKLIIAHHAYYWYSGYDSDQGGWQDAYMKTLPLTIEIRTPDGQPFTADHVTLGDLRRFRDLRGTSHGNWTFHLHGEKDAAAFQETPPQDGNSRVRAGKGFVRIAVEETVASKSAPPLVADRLKPSETRRYNFDLFRVGHLVAGAMSSRTRKQLTLRDPDGAIVATGGGALRFPVTLQTLDKSRDPDGNPRLWSLEAGENVGPSWSHFDVVDVSATVVAETRISTRVLQDRINAIIGEHGEKISIYVEERGKDLLVRMKILDEVSAESIDMWGLLDSRIDSEPQDEGVTKDIAVGVAYNLYHKGLYLIDEDGKKLYVRLYDMKVSYVNISIGASVEIPHAIPALTIDVGIEGYAMVKALLDDLAIDVASVKIRDNHIRLEAGLRLDTNGSFVAETWMRDDPLDIDVATHWTQISAVYLANVYLGILTTVTQETVTEHLESELNSGLRQNFREAVEGAMNKAPQILAALLGDDFTYRGLRLDGDDIVFSYVAPLEPEPKPSEGYVGIIGRSAIHTGPTVWEMTPPTLGDTWSAQNLRQKIDHIVMVMMENRSFNHVLGYRAQMRGVESDGLTRELVEFLNSLEFPDLDPDPTKTKFPIEWLGSEDSDIPKNSVDKKTAFPCHVGHSLSDVAEQLGEPGDRLKTPSGRYINSPKGFIKNFSAERANGFARKDVLGYYEADDLRFFGFLAEHYVYCEKYFCSHPGPTLPNRMFSIGGDVQYDRTGEAILNNNVIGGDDFYLSRALTIFDLLSRKGIPWRVYESFPSLTMLRFFARYVGDNTNIVPIGEHASRLKEDVARHSETPFPSVVFIDPAFHHHPQNDDHPEDARERPVVDMWRGQQFLKEIYDALVSNQELWSRTLLIITYDEHGGFYDHVIPRLAEGLFQPSMPTALGGMGTAGSSMEIRYGLRVPTFVVSPWVPAGKRLDIVLDHCSILKTIIARFLGTRRRRLDNRWPPHWVSYTTHPFLSDRVHASRSFDAYLSAPEPRLDVPASPVMAALAPEAPPRRARAIITNIVSRAQMRRGNVNFHDLTGRLARQLGR